MYQQVYPMYLYLRSYVRTLYRPYLVPYVCVLTYFYVILVVKYDITYECDTLPQRVLGAMRGLESTLVT